ncbi:VCBS repeat-containing protein [Streptomyces sp. JH14]|uniref:FG-GAP repeat domain-containing protein n=1 Tax=Streptomyces sp. JH14 TaxID=2793630 RepID=UPI0023F9CCE9|nr:VCBS repeat-containing protein [Streptomyces sp. JH14]MDF6043793.1 VCBS repeat-containing protein [Streptomyces sp. JH14]
MRRSLIAPLALIASLASLAAASPALADTSGAADPVRPVISALGGDPDDAGYLEFHAVSDSAIDPASIAAQLTLRVSGDWPTTTVTGFSLVSGSAQDGTWRSSERLQLGAHGVYDATVDLADTEGDHPAYLGQGQLRYEDLPVFAGTSLDRTTVDFDHQKVTATGTVFTFDPATGLTTPGWTESKVYLVGTRGSGPYEVAADVQADGSFTATGPVYSGVYVYAVQQDAQTVNTVPVTVTKAPNPTRIVFDKPKATAVYGSSYTVGGTAQYLSSTTGAWTPLPAGNPDTEVLLDGPNGVHAYELGAGGRFSETLAKVTGDTNWTASVGGFGYLQQGSAQADLHRLYSSPGADLTGDGKADLVARDGSGVLWLYKGTGSGSAPYAARTKVGAGWNMYNSLTSTGDLTGDGKADLVARDGSGVLWLYKGTGSGSAPYAARTKVGAGWNMYNSLTSTGDLTGDGKADLVARDGSGVLWLYKGTGSGSAPYAARTKVGAGWNMYNSLTSTGDLTGDGKADLVARDGSGVLWLYKGTGSASAPYAARTKVGAGWNMYNSLTSTGDLTGDGKADLVARDGSGVLWLYKGTGSASAPYAARTKVGAGWNTYNALS